MLALDYGRAHTGVAISDASGTIARPLDDIDAAASEAGLKALSEIVKAHAVERVIVGMPVSLSGALGAQARETEEFIGRLRQALTVPVEALDERFTSTIASQRGRHSQASRHSMAACCLLDDYLGRRGPTGS